MAELTFLALTLLSPPAGSEPCLSARPEGPARPAASLLQNKSPKARGNSSGGPEELEVLPEEEAAGGDEDREKEILMERIQSIKEEKQVPLHPLRTLPHGLAPFTGPSATGDLAVSRLPG